jgi:hypothetical protein
VAAIFPHAYSSSLQLARKILPCIKRTVTFVLARGAMGFLPGVQRGEVGRQRLHAHNKASSCVNQGANAVILLRKNLVEGLLNVDVELWSIVF